MSEHRPWWRTGVVYEIYLRSYADGDGDGVGDLKGARARLDYLADLGVDAVWVTPFFPSPMADAGYDISDFRGVDPLFGTLDDVDGLIADAHALGLRVIIDVVPNHTSDQHPWFQAAVAAGQDSAERHRYVFRDGRGPDGAAPPTDWRSNFGGSAWTRVPDGQWYLHVFAQEQPDLNWDDPTVRADFDAVLRFWLDRGVDGFRVDVAHGLVKDRTFPDLGLPPEQVMPTPGLGFDGHPYWDRDEVHDIYREWNAVLASYEGDRLAVAEAWVWSSERLARYLRPDELQQSFNFSYLTVPWDGPEMHRRIEESIAITASVGATATWVTSNHDIARMPSRLSDDPATGLTRARALALLTLALPGAAYLYTGEELGLPEVRDLPDEARRDPMYERSGRTAPGRDGCRIPMPWGGGEPPFGFGPDGSTASWLPVPPEWRDRSVQAQDADPSSMLRLHRAALALRRSEPALRGEAFAWLDAPSPDVLAFVRGGTDGTGRVVCVVNTGGSPASVPQAGELLLASGPLGDDGAVPAQTAAWFRAR